MLGCDSHGRQRQARSSEGFTDRLRATPQSLSRLLVPTVSLFSLSCSSPRYATQPGSICSHFLFIEDSPKTGASLGTRRTWVVSVFPLRLDAGQPLPVFYPPAAHNVSNACVRGQATASSACSLLRCPMRAAAMRLTDACRERLSPFTSSYAFLFPLIPSRRIYLLFVEPSSHGTGHLSWSELFGTPIYMY